MRSILHIFPYKMLILRLRFPHTSTLILEAYEDGTDFTNHIVSSTKTKTTTHSSCLDECWSCACNRRTPYQVYLALHIAQLADQWLYIALLAIRTACIGKARGGHNIYTRWTFVISGLYGKYYHRRPRNIIFDLRCLLVALENDIWSRIWVTSSKWLCWVWHTF